MSVIILYFQLTQIIYTVLQKIKMLTLLERQLGERQIDIVVEQAQDMRPIVAVAYKQASNFSELHLR